MNHWPFIVAAYALTLGGVAAVMLWSWWSMRTAEAKADAMRGER